MLQCLAVQTAYLIDALFDLAVLVLDELGVQTDPQGFGRVVFVGSVPCFGLSLGDAVAVVVACRTSHQIDTVLGGCTLGHHSRIKHHRQDSGIVLDARFLTCRFKPSLVEFGQELILRIVVVDAVGEPDTLEITLESRELFCVFVVRIIEVQGLECPTDTEVITAVLVE